MAVDFLQTSGQQALRFGQNALTTIFETVDTPCLLYHLPNFTMPIWCIASIICVILAYIVLLKQLVRLKRSKSELQKQIFNYTSQTIQDKRQIEGYKLKQERLEQTVNEMLIENECLRHGLKASEHQCFNMLTLISSSVITTNNEGFITFSNQATCQTLHYEEEELIGIELAELAGEAEQKKLIQEFFAYLNTPPSSSFPFYCRLRDSKNNQMEFKIDWNHLYDNANIKKGFVLSLTNITERKRAEQELESKDKLVRLKLDQLLSQDQDLGEIDHRELLGIHQMQELQDAFSHASQMGSIIKDLNGNNLTRTSNASALFNLLINDGIENKNVDEVKLHHPNDLHPWCKIYKKGYFFFAVAPIIVGGKRLANWYIGQVIDKPQKEEVIKELAERMNVNIGQLSSEFSKSHKISTQRFKFNMDLLWIMAKKISMLSYSTLKLVKELEIKRTAEKQLHILSNAIESAPMSVSITNKDGVFEYINPKFTEATGYSPKEALGKTHALLKSGYHHIQFYSELWKQIQSGLDWKGEIKNKRKDGSMIWERTAISSVKDAEGKITHFISVKEDITEFKKANEQLIWSQNSLASIQRIGRMGSWEYDIQTNNSWWSDEMYRIYGIDYFISANTGMEILEQLIHPDDREQYIALIQTAKTEHSYFSGEFRVVSPEGSINYIHIEGNTAFDEQAKAQKIVSIHQDITELRKTEEIYQKSQETILNIFKSSPDSIIVTDLNGVILDCNAATVGMHFYESKDDFLKKHLLSFVALSSFESIDQILDDVLNGEIIKNQECLFSRRDKSIFYAELSASLMKDTKGKPMAIVIIVKDATIRKEYEQRLKTAKEKAEESDRLKSAFLANVSHEIRTPMNAVVGFANLLSDDQLNPNQKKDFIDEINKSGNKLLKLIDDIIELSRIETGQFNVKIRPCKVNQILNELYATFSKYKESIHNEGLELRIYKDEPQADFSITTDGYWIKRIISYLLDNAFKFTDVGFIEFGYTIQTYNHKKYIQFYVQDTGIGIETKKKDSIFEMFRKHTAESSTALYSGTGLGLSISKHVVEHLGGQMWLDTEFGKGSTFYFSIGLRTQ